MSSNKIDEIDEDDKSVQTIKYQLILQESQSSTQESTQSSTQSSTQESIQSSTQESIQSSTQESIQLAPSISEQLSVTSKEHIIAQESESQILQSQMQTTESPFTVELNQLEQEYFEKVFKDSKSTLDTIISLYKVLFDDEKDQSIFSKTPEQLCDDILQAQFDFDMDETMKKAIIHANREKEIHKILQKKVTYLKEFFDFSFIYYILIFDQTAPIRELPSKNKIKRFTSMLGLQNHKLTQQFLDIHDNEIITDMINDPPFYMRTTLSTDEIQKNIYNNVKPICKKMMESLLRLSIEDIKNAENKGDVEDILSDTFQKINTLVEKNDNIDN